MHNFIHCFTIPVVRITFIWNWYWVNKSMLHCTFCSRSQHWCVIISSSKQVCSSCSQFSIQVSSSVDVLGVPVRSALGVERPRSALLYPRCALIKRHIYIPIIHRCIRYSFCSFTHRSQYRYANRIWIRKWNKLNLKFREISSK